MAEESRRVILLAGQLVLDLSAEAVQTGQGLPVFLQNGKIVPDPSEGQLPKGLFQRLALLQIETFVGKSIDLLSCNEVITAVDDLELDLVVSGKVPAEFPFVIGGELFGQFRGQGRRDEAEEGIVDGDVGLAGEADHQLPVHLAVTHGDQALVPGPLGDDLPVEGVVQLVGVGANDFRGVPKGHIGKEHRLSVHAAGLGAHRFLHLALVAGKGLVVKLLGEAVIGRQGPHLEDDHLPRGGDGKLDVQDHSVQYPLDLPDSGDEGGPGGGDLLQVPADPKALAIAAAGDRIGGAVVAVVHQVVGTVALEIPGEDHPAGGDLFCLSLDKDLFPLPGEAVPAVGIQRFLDGGSHLDRVVGGDV